MRQGYHLISLAHWINKSGKRGYGINLEEKSNQRAPFADQLRFERATHDGVFKFVLEWLRQQGTIRPQVSIETIAQIISWTISGAALQRWRGAASISAEKMADAIMLVVMKGIEGSFLD